MTNSEKNFPDPDSGNFRFSTLDFSLIHDHGSSCDNVITKSLSLLSKCAILSLIIHSFTIYHFSNDDIVMPPKPLDKQKAMAFYNIDFSLQNQVSVHMIDSVSLTQLAKTSWPKSWIIIELGAKLKHRTKRFDTKKKGLYSQTSVSSRPR